MKRKLINIKKLLSFLGTITIAGSGMAGLVGNAPTPSKTESNSLQTNKLETLNREKRNSGNENKYEYRRGVYHVFYLSNDTVNNIQQNLDLGGGIASVVSI